VCGDLTSAFHPYEGQRFDLPKPLDRDGTVERIHAARFRDRPKAGAPLTPDARALADIAAFQEAGARPSCPLPYELVVNAEPRSDGLGLVLEARRGASGQSQGAPFAAYLYTPEFQLRSYAVGAGDVVRDVIPSRGAYHVRIDGPNGFMREFVGDGGPPPLSIVADHAGRGKARTIELRLANTSTTPVAVTITDESYGAPERRVHLRAGKRHAVRLNVAASHGWYDVRVRAAGLAYRYAGRVETGEWSVTDPAMGRV
jgi:phospholipase C